MQESRLQSTKGWSLLNPGRIKASFRKYGCGALLVLLAILGSQAFRATPEAMPAAAPPRIEVPTASRHSTLNAELFQNFVALSGSRMYPRLSREIVESVIKYSGKYDLSPILVLAIAKTESEFYPFALSNKNAKGLMQINPEANQRLLIEKGIFKEPADIFDPERSIEAGCFLLRRFINESPDFNVALDKYLGADSISYKAKIHEVLGKILLLGITEELNRTSNHKIACAATVEAHK
jgi:hypothetical protein